MPNLIPPTPPTDSSSMPASPAERLAKRLDDLRLWVLHETALPETERVPLGRIDHAVRNFLGSFNSAASKRARLGVTLSLAAAAA